MKSEAGWETLKRQTTFGFDTDIGGEGGRREGHTHTHRGAGLGFKVTVRTQTLGRLVTPIP